MKVKPTSLVAETQTPAWVAPPIDGNPGTYSEENRQQVHQEYSPAASQHGLQSHSYFQSSELSQCHNYIDQFLKSHNLHIFIKYIKCYTLCSVFENRPDFSET